MQFSTAAVALFAAVAAAVPAAPAQPTASAAGPTPNGPCNLLSCAVSLGQGGLKCVEFAFGGSGQQCMSGLLKNVETMPPACANCLNDLLLPSPAPAASN